MLIEITNKVNKQINRYLLNYYNKEDKIAPYLIPFVLDFIKTCRYHKDNVRPLLTKLGYQIAGGEDDEYIIPAMSAVHLLLLSSIPVDDIIDGLERQKKYILQNLLYELAKAYSVSAKLKEDCKLIIGKNYRKHPYYKKIEEIISYCIESQDGSHALEVNIQGKIPLSKYSLNDYFKLIDQAQDIFFSESFVIGGLVAGVNENTEKIMRSFGIELGKLCQIRDDYLDYVDPKITGKKLPFADLYSRRKRFPVLTIYWFGNKEQKQRIKEILKKDNLTDEDIYDTMSMILDKNIRKQAQKIIDKIYKRVLLRLKQLPKTQPAFSILNELVNLFYIKVDDKI